MTDPLTPLSQLIRALATRKSSSRPGASTQTPAERLQTSQDVSLQSQLVSRLAALDRNDPRRLRETFVETVLLWELGASLAHDPAFAEMVNRVSEQLSMHPAAGKLQGLLLQLASKAEGPLDR